MVERKAAIKNEWGLHLRPATLLCQKAMEYDSRIILRFRSKEFNAKSVLGILSACIQQEDEVTLICTGPDEAEAAAVLGDFLESGMEE